MPASDSYEMETKVVYNKGGKRNGYLPDTFDRPPDWENEYSEEDEVFVEHPRLDHSSATKPLMYPRQRAKVRGRGPHCRCRPIINAVCCFLFLVLSLGSLMSLVVYFVNKHNKSKEDILPNKHTPVLFLKQKPEVDYSDIVGCDHIDVEDVWVVGIPKLLTESAFRLVDVNQDGVLDIIFGFATGADGYSIPSIVCDIYFEGTFPCFGGLLALEGMTGKELWRHYSDHEMYGINCEADLNSDGVKDCLAGGRAGAFQAISGKDGALIWNFDTQDAKNDIMNLYTAQLIKDIDGDGVVDVLAIHGGDPLQDPGSAFRLSGRLILFSGKTGKVIKWVGVPDNKESYYSPQWYILPGGVEMVLFGTGGETHGGSLWRITLHDLINGDIDKARAIVTDNFKGVMTPPVLIDLTSDGIEDIVLPMFNSSVLAIDGFTFKVLWNHTFPGAESYNTPSPGFYNDDDVPDFLVKYAFGPGFPVYYHSVTTILDGRDGTPLIDPPMRDTVGAQASGLTISLEGRGNDIFLYWAADCIEHSGEGGEFHFVTGTNVHEQSRSDFCRLRFKTKGYSKIYAISSNIKSPGTTVYYSEARLKEEHNKWINTSAEGIEFVRKHPEYIEEYEKFTYDPSDEPVDSIEEVYSRVKSGIFGHQGGENDIYQPVQKETLFDAPLVSGVQRTSYKKGPPIDSYRSQPRNSLLGRNKGTPYLDYDYYADPFGQFAGNAYEKPQLGMNRSPYYRGASKSYQTTPRYNLPRNSYRGRLPTGRRFRSQVKERTPSKPESRLGMKAERRKRYSANSDVLNGDNAYIPKNKPKIPLHLKSNVLERTNDKFSAKNDVENKLKKKFSKRKRRHVGPHDEDGLQRLLSTGSLAPSSLPVTNPLYNNSIDFIFATYWFFPAKTRAVLPQDQKCIEKKLSQENQRFDPKNKYYGMDHDAYEHTVTNECLTKSEHDLPDQGTYESQTQYNPFNIHMGQMTVYRVRLTCTCKNNSDVKNGKKRCSSMLPFKKQSWTGYMGNRGDSHWNNVF